MSSSGSQPEESAGSSASESLGCQTLQEAIAEAMKNVYHEKETREPRGSSEDLSGMHCINTALQFNAISKSTFLVHGEIADRNYYEKHLAELAGDGLDFDEAIDVARTINENREIETMELCFDSKGLEMKSIKPLSNEGKRRRFEVNPVMVCYEDSHWYTVRRFGKQQWINLDSRLSEPVFMTVNDVSALLSKLYSGGKGNGVFSVTGHCLRCPTDAVFDALALEPETEEESDDFCHDVIKIRKIKEPKLDT